MSQKDAASRVVVLGMHRSGTSAVTRVLNLLGLPLGPSDDFHHGWDNPTGHWESGALNACNDQILGVMGGSWEMPPRLPVGWENSDRANAMLGQMSGTFREIYGGLDGPWIWKDPRTCLTFPLWRRVLGDPAVVLVVRSPHTIARSLRAREHMRPTYSLALWQLYLASALQSTAGLPAVVVNFEKLVGQPEIGVADIACGLRAIGVPVKSDTAAAVESLISKHDSATPLFHMSRKQRSLWEIAQRLPPVSQAFAPPRETEPHRNWRLASKVRVIASRPMSDGLLPRLADIRRSRGSDRNHGA